MRVHILLIFLITATIMGCQTTQSTTRKELKRLQSIVDKAVGQIEQCDENVREECLGIAKTKEFNQEVFSLLENKELVKKCFDERQQKCRNKEFLIAQMPQTKDTFALSKTRPIQWIYPWGRCIFGGIDSAPLLEQDKISCTSTQQHITYIREISALTFSPSLHYTNPARNCMAMEDKELPLSVCESVTKDNSPKIMEIPNSPLAAVIYTYQMD